MRMNESHVRAILAMMSLALATGGDSAAADGPAFACDRVEAGSIEDLVCHDAELSSLDRLLAETYAAAQKKAVNEHPPLLKAEQRGWIKGRNDCWKSSDVRSCVKTEYQRRTAELQARYRLLAGAAPVTFACGGQPANEIAVTYFATQPPSLIAERGDSVSLMFLQPGDGDATYHGRNEIFRLQGNDAFVTWGHQAPELRCSQSR